MEFTLPVVVMYRRENGEVGSSNGTFIVLNNEGWVLTASHIIEAMMSFENEIKANSAYKANVAEINSDSTLSRTERKKKLRSLDRPRKNPVVNFSSWWGRDDWQLEIFHGHPAFDIAIGKISEFDGSSVTNYPVFKNPDINFDPGICLCKLGYPFNDIQAGYDEKNNRFMLPAETFPMSLFPIEGIFTRIRNIELKKGTPPAKLVETSSPGLMGQSGGPTFDSEGRIWAMQSRTAHYSLGFPPGQKNQEHQFLNVGMGTHAEVIINFLESKGVKYDVSDN